MVSFNNIIGHEEIIRHLQNAIKTGKVSHSYIFTGQSRLRQEASCNSTYAMTLQCEARGTEPCQKCDSCKKGIRQESSGYYYGDIMRSQVLSLLMRSVTR